MAPRTTIGAQGPRRGMGTTSRPEDHKGVWEPQWDTRYKGAQKSQWGTIPQLDLGITVGPGIKKGALGS